MGDTYTYTQVTRVTPKGGTIAGGTSVTITGFGFNFATGGVTFGGVAATDVVIVSNTSITAVTPEHSTGAVDVVVAGVGTGASLYTYQNPATALLPRVPVTSDEKNGWKLDVYGAPKWLMVVKQRLENLPLIDAGSVVGGAALSRVNDTNVTLTLSGSPENALLRAVTITAGWSGALSAARGGTGIQTYTVGDLLYASNSITLAKLADVSAGSYLRSGGVATAPVWSTLTLPNTATTGDLPYASASNTIAMLADVSAGSYLRSGGVATAPVWSTLKIPNSAATGDLLYGSAANTLSLRTIGSTADVLTVSGGLPVWAPPAAATAVVVTDDTTTNATMYPTWVTASSGSLPIKVTSTKLTFNPSTGTLTVPLAVHSTSVSTPSIITAAGALTITPAAGSNLAVSLSTTGDFVVNTNLLYADTSAAFVGIGIAIPTSKLHVVGKIYADHADVALDAGQYTDYNNGNVGASRFGIRAASGFLQLYAGSDTGRVLVQGTTGNVSINTGAAPTAVLHLKAGTTSASTAPLKFNSGSLMSAAEAGAVEFLTDDYYATITTGAARKGIVLNDGTALTATRVPFATTNGRLTDDSDMTFATDTLTVTKLSAPTSVSTGTLAQTGKTTTYNNIATAGWGVEAIYGSGRSTAQTAAVASVATYTIGAADGSFLVSANVNVTTSTTHNFAVQVDYTDETNTAQTLTLTLSQLAGALVIAITNVTGAGPYEGVPLHIRCKASTAITIKTAGTFTTVTYNVEGSIRQIA